MDGWGVVVLLLPLLVLPWFLLWNRANETGVSVMAIPNLQHIVEQCKNENPEAWKNAHTGNAHTEDFIRLLVPMLQAEDPRFGLNGKRGNPDDISDDAVNVLCDAEDSEGRTPDGEPCAVVDVIAGAGGPSPAPAWSVFTTVVEGSGANVQPGPPPIPVPTWPSYEELGGDEGAKKITRILDHDYRWANRPGLDGDCGGWLRRTDYDFLTGKVTPVEESTRVHRDEWLRALGLIRVEDGMQMNTHVCGICGQSVAATHGQPIPLIPHAQDCTTRPKP